MNHLNRRAFVGAGLFVSMAPRVASALALSQASVERVDRIVIDLPDEPVNIHPAKAYADIEWSIVHSVFDALIGFDAEGVLLPIAAETFELIDDVTWEVTLRSGMVFHDGSPVTAGAVVRGFDLVTGSDSLVSDIFGVVSTVEEIDDYKARIVVSSPSPWLPAQMAAWHVLIPENFEPEQPIGSGPFQFDRWSRGEAIELSWFEDYKPVEVKGTAIADAVVYHFVPEDSTRISNLLSGSTDIASFRPIDVLDAFDGSPVTLRDQSLAGSWFIRIATDVEPFDDVRVRQALNLALDLDAFIGILVHESCKRLATLYPGPMALGFDDNLTPFAYDPEAARALLAEAGYPDGISAVKLEVSSDASVAVCEAIIGQWAEVGIKAELIVSDLGSFNATWTDSEAPPLRMASWRPMFDPSTLLNLVWYSNGVLSRYNNLQADKLIETGGTVFGEDRAEAYRELGSLLHEDAAAVFLWNLVHVAAVSPNAELWTARPDQWVMPLNR